MLVLVVTMLAILAVAAATWPWSWSGWRAAAGGRLPQLARQLRRVARHLNGEGRPPRRLQALDRR